MKRRKKAKSKETKLMYKEYLSKGEKNNREMRLQDEDEVTRKKYTPEYIEEGHEVFFLCSQIDGR